MHIVIFSINCNVIIDRGSSENIVLKTLVNVMGLKKKKLAPYKIRWIKKRQQRELQKFAVFLSLFERFIRVIWFLIQWIWMLVIFYWIDYNNVLLMQLIKEGILYMNFGGTARRFIWCFQRIRKRILKLKGRVFLPFLRVIWRVIVMTARS